MRGNKVDANQQAIVEALRGVGALWISTAGDPTVGFDGICCFRGRTYLCEIKDGHKPASARKLTDRERERLIQLKTKGVRLHIWESVDAALRDIGAMT